MSAPRTALTFEKSVKAAPARVYHAFTNSTILRKWLCDVATTDPKPGGRFYLAWNSGFYTAGEFIQLKKDQSVSFTWNGRAYPAPTRVSVSLSNKNGSTHVQLDHFEIGTDETWDQLKQEIEKGWKESLENLASVLETGEDLRLVNRPMLGIGLSDFDEKIAQQIGVPVSKGLRLDSTLPGMGAAEAGLRSNDVIVEFAGYAILDFASIPTALSGKKAGDVVEVIYYRGSEKKTVQMKLSRRPLPEIPWSIAELAAQLSQIRQKRLDEIEQFLQGVSDQEAAHKPALGEWSIKDVLAHLIQGERGLHTNIGELITSREPQYDDFPGNLSERIVATVAAYPTTRDLFNQLKSANQESIALIKGLPAEFMELKGTYWRFAYSELESDFHHDSHMEQMRVALDSARKA